MRRHLAPLLPYMAGRVTLLDLGTGDGAVLGRLADWVRSRGLAVAAVGVDAHPEVLAVAGRRAREADANAVRLVRADGLRLPFADDSVDLAITILTLHHFDAAHAAAFVAEMARVARRAVLVSDLERTRLNHLGARALAATLWRGNPITAHDGPLSVLRAFTVAELAAVGREAGLRRVRVRRHQPFRLVLEGRP
jgi:ubiquinone/menaquinone biosynthesis C-methylase UbiE